MNRFDPTTLAQSDTTVRSKNFTPSARNFPKKDTSVTCMNQPVSLQLKAVYIYIYIVNHCLFQREEIKVQNQSPLLVYVHKIMP